MKINDIKNLDLNELILLKGNIDNEIEHRANTVKKDKWEKVKQAIMEYIEFDSIRILYPNGTSFLDIADEEDVEMFFAVAGEIELE
jgi:hypothetical protein